ncbi:MAG: hypothetical protein WCU00_03810, partial [Candidatus Latescibacterota bacterium]
ETFSNWTLLYALGGSESVMALYEKALEGHLKQYKDFSTKLTDMAAYGAYYKEFFTQNDWLHVGESMRGFQFYGLSKPENTIYQKRTRRFAGLYMNEDPDAPNYDPEHKIIRSVFNGSKGPMLRESTVYDWVGDPVVGRFHILHKHPGIDSGNFERMLDFEKSYPAMLKDVDGMPYEETLHVAGDNPFNLIATNLALNAYMLSHEEKYKKWILEYVDAWKERTIKNGGNIPTNIGLDGTIGGEYGGKWYKGVFGWSTKPYNIFQVGMWRGFSNAYLVTGDERYLDVLRKQLDNLYAQKKIVDGKVLLPRNYGDEGWNNWSGNLFIPEQIKLYLWSMDRNDLKRVPIDGWLAFLDGKNPEYPEKALRDDFGYIRRQMEKVRNDPTTADTRLADWAMFMNPATTNNLYSLMLGGYVSGKDWGLHCRVRYFDPDRHRAGLPQDVASLVTAMDKKMTKVTIVNINQVEPRNVIVQTGGYGEHQCEYVEVNGVKTEVNNRFFTVHLAPGAGAELIIYARRYANQPTFALPWQGDNVPLY